MTHHELAPGEARDPEGRNNIDHVVTAGTLRDRRRYEWGADSDLKPRVRRQPDWYFNAREPGSSPLKRGQSSEIRRMEHDRWHIGAAEEGRDWTCVRQTGSKGQIKDATEYRTNIPQRWGTRMLCREATRLTRMPEAAPEQQWSMSPARCYVCWDQLPDVASKSRYCDKPCRRVADAGRKARKRRLAGGTRKYPRDARGDYVNQAVALPRTGIQYVRSVGRSIDLEVRHGIMHGIQRRARPEPSAVWTATLESILYQRWDRAA